MIDFIQSFQLQPYEWFLAALCALLVGISKTGIMGVSLAVVSLLAMIFGARESTGFMLPMLILADVHAVLYYTKHTSWRHVFRLLPWTLAGVGAATVLGQIISGEVFTVLLAVIIILGTLLIIANDMHRSKTVPHYWWFSGIMGISGGFTSMIGNAAAPVMSLYLLSMQLPKNIFIGTAAWFFFCLNLLKVPFHIFLWKTITVKIILFDLLLLPLIALGAFLGVKIVKRIPEKVFRILVIGLTLVAAVLLLVR